MIEILDMENTSENLKECLRKLDCNTRFILMKICNYAEEHIKDKITITNENIKCVKNIDVNNVNKNRLVEDLNEDKKYYLEEAENIRKLKTIFERFKNEF